MTILLYIVVILVCGKLWRMGGDGQRWARMIGVPLLLTAAKLVSCIHLGWSCLYILIYAPALYGLMSLFSYGLSSPVHKFVVFLCDDHGSDGNHKPVEVITRGICGLLWALAAYVFASVTGSWPMFVWYILFLGYANGIIGGTVKDVEKSERLVGISVALALLV